MNTPLQTVIPCVHYDDFLALTLPHNLPLLDRVTVLTSRQDAVTIALSEQLGVQLFLTDAWYAGGALNKARALNEWVTHASAHDPEAWLMILDADILLFRSIPGRLGYLDPTCLYGPRRRMCEDAVQLGEFLRGDRSLAEFPLEPLVRVSMKLSDHGEETAVNPAALSGYFQLWHPASAGPRYIPETGTSYGYDVLFGLQFDESSRVLLDGDVLHIGPSQVNWSGRQSPRWNVGTLR